MIDTGNNTWTVFTARRDSGLRGWLVISTQWNKNGPTGNEAVLFTCETEDEAKAAAQASQGDYDRVRANILDGCKEVNK